MTAVIKGPVFSTDEEFCQYLEKDLDLKIKVIISQGDCVYAAIAFHIYGNENLWKDVREEVAMEVTINRDIYERHLEQGQTITERVIKILTPGAWGGYLEIMAAANRFNTNIMVYQADGKYPTFPRGFPFFRTVRLSYHNHVHYNAVYYDELE